MSWKSALSGSASTAAAGLKSAGSALKSKGGAAYAWTAPRAKTAGAKTWNGMKTGAQAGATYGKKGAKTGAKYGGKGLKYGGKGALVAGTYAGKGVKYGATTTGNVVRESGELADYLERVDAGAVANPTVTDLYQNVQDTEPEAMIELLEAGDIDDSANEITIDDDMYDEIRRGSYGRRLDAIIDGTLGPLSEEVDSTLERHTDGFGGVIDEQYEQAKDEAEDLSLQQNMKRVDWNDRKKRYSLAAGIGTAGAGAALGPGALLGLPVLTYAAGKNAIWQGISDAHAEEAADQIEDAYGGYTIDIVP